MKIIPLIYFQKGKIYTEKEKSQISLTDLLAFVDKDTEIYVYDNDGIFRNKPNLCTYQKISTNCKLWVDDGPRTLGDVVDTVLAGATSITFRRNLWPKANVSSMREIIESSIYEAIDSENIIKQKTTISSETDGIVISSYKNRIDRDFIYDDLIKNICREFNVYVIESDASFFSYWKNIGVKGLLVELNSYKKVKQDVI